MRYFKRHLYNKMKRSYNPMKLSLFELDNYSNWAALWALPVLSKPGTCQVFKTTPHRLKDHIDSKLDHSTNITTSISSLIYTKRCLKLPKSQLHINLIVHYYFFCREYGIQYKSKWCLLSKFSVTFGFSIAE